VKPLVAVGLLAAVCVAADKKSDQELLQGAWKMVSLERDGRVFEYPEGTQPRWVVKGNKLLKPDGGEQFATFTLDQAKSPKLLDLTNGEVKRAAEAIYDLDGDMWTICINPSTDEPKERPTRFSTKDNPQWKVWVLRREKP
jgi:uncharacterized protein (TIGR03067 family)